MEMVEQERELRAQVEQASVLRVEELEAQVVCLPLMLGGIY